MHAAIISTIYSLHKSQYSFGSQFIYNTGIYLVLDQQLYVLVLLCMVVIQHKNEKHTHSDKELGVIGGFKP